MAANRAYLHFSYCRVCDLNVEHPSEQLISIGSTPNVFIRSARDRDPHGQCIRIRTSIRDMQRESARAPENCTRDVGSLHSRAVRSSRVAIAIAKPITYLSCRRAKRRVLDSNAHT